MSMAVDFTTPLTAEERDYLNARGRQEEIDRADAAHGAPEEMPDYSGDGTGPRTRQLDSGLAAIARPEELLAQLREMGVNVQVVDEPVDGDEVSPYDEWSLTDLKAEIDRRNEGRDDSTKLSKAGGVQALADRLYADDDASGDAGSTEQ